MSQLPTDIRNQTASLGSALENGPWNIDIEGSVFRARDAERPTADLDAQRLRIRLTHDGATVSKPASSGVRLGGQIVWESASPRPDSDTLRLSPLLDIWRHLGPVSTLPTLPTLRLQYRERVPTFFERYGNRGLFQGNPDLKTERAATLSVTQRSAGQYWPDVALFTRWLWDGITPQYNARGTGQSTNAGRASVSGISLSGAAAPARTWQWRWRLDWQHSRDRGSGSVDGKQLPGRPEWIADWQLRRRWASVSAGYAFHFENGAFREGVPFGNPAMFEFRGLGARRMYDHEHEEPVTMGLLADKYLRGVRNVHFRFGGPHCELAKGLYDMGLLSSEPVELDGAQVVPMRLISKLTPPAPKYREEIEQVLAEGMVMEEGAFLVRVDGVKDGSPLRIDTYVNAPDLTTSFAKAGITHESYYTGQGAFLFTKLLVHGKVGLTGVFPPEALDAEARAYYFAEAAKLDITLDEVMERRLY